jgi:hypothetical protein
MPKIHSKRQNPLGIDIGIGIGIGDRREEEVQLPQDSFEVPYSPPAAAGDGDAHADGSSEPE